jgi:iron complex transport system substrate-binding protein
MRAGLDEVRAATLDLQSKNVLVVVGRDPLYVAGPGSHLDELIRLAGGRNLAADAASPYQQFSIEAVLERGPEVIVDTSGDAEYWSRWPFLPAVRDGSVYRVDPDVLAIPGMRLPEMARSMARCIHPGALDTGTKD